MRKIAMLLAMGLSFVTMNSSARADDEDAHKECKKTCKDTCVMTYSPCDCGTKKKDGVCVKE